MYLVVGRYSSKARSLGISVKGQWWTFLPGDWYVYTIPTYLKKETAVMQIHTHTHIYICIYNLSGVAVTNSKTRLEKEKKKKESCWPSRYVTLQKMHSVMSQLSLSHMGLVFGLPHTHVCRYQYYKEYLHVLVLYTKCTAAMQSRWPGFLLYAHACNKVPDPRTTNATHYWSGI